MKNFKVIKNIILLINSLEKAIEYSKRIEFDHITSADIKEDMQMFQTQLQLHLTQLERLLNIYEYE